MNWVSELIDLYEKNTDQVGVVETYKNNTYSLLPLFHTTVTAHIVVVIDQKGDLIDAKLVELNDRQTIIPITNESNSRTGTTVAPHPLCDNLKYLAGDLSDYCNHDKKWNRAYLRQLEKWIDSDFTHEKVKSIYQYIKKETLIKDLVQRNIVQLDINGRIDVKQKIQGSELLKAFVRFIVRSASEELYQENPDECWKDRSLQECYIRYARSQEIVKDKELCYLTGNIEPVSYLHSKKIRNDGDGAKLISANDSQNFTYRGRFTSREEAFAVGNETSQKLHNALKWIIRKQGTSFDTLTLVTWESDLLQMPAWNVDTDTIQTEYEMQDDWEDDWDDNELVFDGNEITANKFYQALRGYGKKVDHTSFMILLGFDAATPGRLAMVENQTLDTAHYLKNIEKWHESCGWIHEKWKDKKRIQFYGMVGVKDVADILFGIEDKGRLTIVDANGKKLYAEVAKRLLPCIWNGTKIPYDYVSRAVQKASSPLCYKDRKNWERVLTLACSLVKKYRNEENEREDWNVALDRNETDRNYLYGRLLAVANRIEEHYYYIGGETDGARITNAKRYMTAFSQRPFDTWKIIEESIQPYLNKHKISNQVYYGKVLDEIYNLFDMNSFKNNQKLDGLYLLGFHSQDYDFRTKKEHEDKKNEEE